MIYIGSQSVYCYSLLKGRFIVILSGPTDFLSCTFIPLFVCVCVSWQGGEGVAEGWIVQKGNK